MTRRQSFQVPSMKLGKMFNAEIAVGLWAIHNVGDTRPVSHSTLEYITWFSAPISATLCAVHKAGYACSTTRNNVGI